jgi:hypothetical protein
MENGRRLVCFPLRSDIISPGVAMSFQGSAAPGSPHRFLAQLVGGWTGTTRTWPEPDGVPSEAPTQGSIQLILDGRFVIYLYQTSAEGEAQHGMYTFGYDTTLDQYEASWVDSFHNNTAIMFCTGNPRERGFAVLGSYPAHDGGPDWGWRTEVELIDRDHLNITAFNISPEGGEAKAIESLLNRVK